MTGFRCDTAASRRRPVSISHSVLTYPCSQLQQEQKDVLSYFIELYSLLPRFPGTILRVKCVLQHCWLVITKLSDKHAHIRQNSFISWTLGFTQSAPPKSFFFSDYHWPSQTYLILLPIYHTILFKLNRQMQEAMRNFIPLSTGITVPC